MTVTTRPTARETSAGQLAPSSVSVSHVSKAFKIPHQQYHTIKERVLHPFRARTFDVLQAVDDISVDIRRGEFFGIIGRNGSGKSTLLKCIAGIYNIDAGTLAVTGRLSPFIELGVGFNMDLTARDNIMINAIMLGMSPKEARRRFDQIIAFAELEDFLDLKLKNYSSGMTVRLAFSVAIQVEAEILLIDEVLAVGDASFQQKCFDEFERLKREGQTILFVTHDMGSIERFCDRAMLLERGRMVEIGEPGRVARRYNQLNFGRTAHERAPDSDKEEYREGYRPAEIIDAWFEDATRTRVATLAYGETCRACMEVRFNEPFTDPIFGVTLRNEWGATIFAITSDFQHGPTGHFAAGTTVIVRLQFDNCLVASRYNVTPSVARHGTGADALDLREDMASLLIHGGHFAGGVVNLAHTFEIVAQ
jgi:ABC-type polysaccharide/polyol phosphate transport system ATPase subunit